MNRVLIYKRDTGQFQFGIENESREQVERLTEVINQGSAHYLAKAESESAVEGGAPKEPLPLEPGAAEFVATEDVSTRIKPAIAVLKDLLARAEQKRKDEAEHKAALAALTLESQNAVALSDQSGLVYITMDGDNIGNQVAQAQFSDDESKVRDMSRRIDAGKQLFETWAQQYNGTVIESGGDEGQVKMPASAIDHIEEFRKQYQSLVGATVSVGVGKLMSESIQARELAKLRGKDQTVIFDDQTKKELATRMEAKGATDDPVEKLKESHVLDKNDLGVATSDDFTANQQKEAEYRAWLNTAKVVTHA